MTDFLGQGWAFPVSVNGQGSVTIQKQDADIKEACRIILGTALGERAMRPDFGCGVYDLVFDFADVSFLGKIEYFVKAALSSWEPRIRVETVEAFIEDSRVFADVQYVILQTNTEDNVVVPFYQKELP